MRIAVVHSFYDPSKPSGENEVVRDQCEQLASSGHVVEPVFASSPSGGGSSLYKTRSAITVASGFGLTPRSVLQAFQPDVVHVHNLFPNWGSQWLSEWQRSLVATVHNFRPMCAAGTLYRDGNECTACPDKTSVQAVVHSCYRDSRLASLPLAIATRKGGRTNRLLKSAQKIVLLNADARGYYSKIVPQEKLEVVPNFVPLSDECRAISRSAVRSGFVFVGRLTNEKGINQLLDVWPGDCSLTVIGDGPLSSAVRRKAAVMEHVTVLGAMKRSEVRRLLAGKQALVIPSVWAEGLPTVAIEAMSVGTPVIASKHIAAREQIAPYKDLVFDPSDLKSLYNSLSWAQKNSRVASARVQELYDKNFSAAAWSSRIESLYEEVVADRRSPRP